MKKLRLNFKRPMVFWQPTDNKKKSGRMRIIYPDGKCEWSPSCDIGKDHSPLSCFNKWDHPSMVVRYPCWAKRMATSREQYNRMIDYDKSLGFPKAELIGVL